MGCGVFHKYKDSGAMEPYHWEPLPVEESWHAGKHFLKLEKMPSIALADLGTTAQAISRAVAVIEILVC